MNIRKVHKYVYVKHLFGLMAINSEEFHSAFNDFLNEQAAKGRELVFACQGSNHLIFRIVEPFAIEFTEVE